MTVQFDENKHARDQGGKFAPTHHAEAEGVTLTASGTRTGSVDVDIYQSFSGRIRAEAELNSRAETRLMVAAVADEVQQRHPQDDTLILHDFSNRTSLEVVGSTGAHGQVHLRDEYPGAFINFRAQIDLGSRLRSDWGNYNLENADDYLSQALPPAEPLSSRHPAVRVRTLPIAPIYMRPGHTDPVESVLSDERDDIDLADRMSPDIGTVYSFTLGEDGQVAEVNMDTGWHRETTEDEAALAIEHIQSVLDEMPDNTRTGTRWIRHLETGAPIFARHVDMKGH